MNKHDLGKLLSKSPETSMTVGDRLHQDIMRAVRLAAPAGRVSGFAWAGPALGGALAVMVLAVLHFSTAATQPGPQPLASQHKVSPAAWLELGDRLKGMSGESLVNENELEREIERLKSDLRRFEFRS
jgi:hypothetical protein